MMTFSDKEIKKIYLGDKKIWGEGAGGVTPAMVEEAVKRGNTETLHILYQADPKKAIKESDAALEMLAEAYPEFYEFVEFPGGKLNRLDLPSEDIYFGPVKNEVFGTFVGGPEDGKAFNRASLNRQLGRPQRTNLDEFTVWHCIYDGNEKKIFYIPNGILAGFVSFNSLSSEGLISGKKIQTTALSFSIETPTEKEYQKFACGLADGTFARLSDEEMNFIPEGHEWTKTRIIVSGVRRIIQRAGTGRAIYIASYDDSSGEENIFRPILTLSLKSYERSLYERDRRIKA